MKLRYSSPDVNVNARTYCNIMNIAIILTFYSIREQVKYS